MSASNKSATIRQLTAALEVIAKFLYEPQVDAKTNEETNALAYVQKQMLNALCWKAMTLIENTRNTNLPKAADDVKRAQRNYRGDEISGNQLRSRIEWHDKLVEQLSILQTFYAKASEVYEMHTGESFEKGQLQPAKPKQFDDALLQRANQITKANVHNDETVEPNADV